MPLKKIINNYKKSICSLKKSAIDFEKGKINIKILIDRIIAEKTPLALEDTVDLALENPESLRKKQLYEICSLLMAFHAKALESMRITMQKLAKARPKIPVKRYGGNVVEITPAALTVALEYANKLELVRTDKNRIEFLKSFEVLLKKLERLIDQHSNYVLALANTRKHMVEMLEEVVTKNHVMIPEKTLMPFEHLTETPVS